MKKNTMKNRMKDFARKNLTALSLKFEDGKLLLLDQTRLPHEEVWLESFTPEDTISHIQRLAVRGAPLIGVAAALCLAQYAQSGASSEQIKSAAMRLREARPTAVNLMKAIDRMLETSDVTDFSPSALLEKAIEIFDEDVELCEKIATRAAKLIEDGDTILTHCNTGGLATAGVGTALGAIRKAHESRKKIHVYVDETRPLFQGSRLTAWELQKLGIPYTLICDHMAALLMSQGKIQKVFVGADRIARNGDSANKIGTFSIAIAAKYHHIPFYVVAPNTTVDETCLTGKDIPIEERGAEEVRLERSPKDCQVFNPAFDVTPAELITEIIRA
jgi:methylthioribose-1-phosphate isomerase